MEGWGVHWYVLWRVQPARVGARWRGQRCSSTLTGLASRGLNPTALPYHYESSPTYKGNFGKIRPMGELCRRRPNMERLRLCAWRGQRPNREVSSNFLFFFREPLFLSRICQDLGSVPWVCNCFAEIAKQHWSLGKREKDIHLFVGKD